MGRRAPALRWKLEITAANCALRASNCSTDSGVRGAADEEEDEAVGEPMADIDTDDEGKPNGAGDGDISGDGDEEYGGWKGSVAARKNCGRPNPTALDPA